MVALIKSSTLVGIDAVTVDVECVIAPGQLPQFAIVGLPTAAVKEGAVRVRSALKTVGYEVPAKRVTVNLAPADLRKPGSAFDLPTALSILIAEGVFDGTPLDRLLVLGELGLDGSIRAVPGVLAAAMLAKERGLRGVLVPDRSAAEALVVEDLEVYGATHLDQIIETLAGRADLPLPSKATGPRRRRRRVITADMSDVRGQEMAREAIEVAVSGGHNLLLTGPPGTGKTMLARRIPTVLPKMTQDEALETTKIYSALGLADGLVEERPFRAPHHTISTAALLGGGSHPRPGEISLAHNGVLFLDELPEFSRSTIESLRQPLEDRTMTIGRISGTIRIPASFLLVAAANPCPCGWLGFTARECTCSVSACDRYSARLSGPLLDRIDLQIRVEPVSLPELRDARPSEHSAAMRDRVVIARDRQRARLAPWGIRTNAEMTSKVLRECCKLDSECERALAEIVAKRQSMSARGIDRLLKVARTVADILGHAEIKPEDLREASRYRAVDPTADVIVATNPPPPGPGDGTRRRLKRTASKRAAADEDELARAPSADRTTDDGKRDPEGSPDCGTTVAPKRVPDRSPDRDLGAIGDAAATDASSTVDASTCDESSPDESTANDAASRDATLPASDVSSPTQQTADLEDAPSPAIPIGRDASSRHAPVEPNDGDASSCDAPSPVEPIAGTASPAPAFSVGAVPMHSREASPLNPALTHEGSPS